MLNNLTRLEANFSHRRSTVEPRALIEKAVTIGKTLGEGSGIVRKYVNNLEGILPRRLGLEPRRALSYELRHRANNSEDEFGDTDCDQA